MPCGVGQLRQSVLLTKLEVKEVGYSLFMDQAAFSCPMAWKQISVSLSLFSLESESRIFEFLIV